MALPTKAQWADDWNALSYYENLGMLLADTAHIFRAFRPIAHDKATIKVNWTDGATAATPATTAGTGHTGAPAQVDDTFTKEFSAKSSQAVDVFAGTMQTVGFESEFSIRAAIHAIYRKWVTDLVTTGTGADYALWGFETFITNAATAGSTMSKTDTTAADTLENIDGAVTALPSDGENICLVDAQGYNYVKKLIRSLGGVASNEVKSEAFGARFLEYSGVTFFYCSQMDSKGTSPSIDSQFNFFNMSPTEGCQLLVPGTEDPFLIQGPKQTKGEFDEVYDIALRSQIIYTSPRAAYKLIQRVS
jgi:hypothetical protein